MTIFGNLFLIIAAFIYFSLFSTLYIKKKPRAGDAILGYFWGIIILNIAFLVCISLATIAIGWQGGFEWISASKSSRYAIVVFGLLLAIIGSALCGLFKYENGPVPAIFRFFSSFAPALIPLVLIYAGAILLNHNFRIKVPMNLYKWPLILVILIGLISILSAIWGLISQSFRNQTARAERNIQEHNENNQRMISDIESFDVMKNLAYLLLFTDAYKDAEVKEKALAKVKTHPNWEKEIAGFLETENAPDAYNFLASNEVDSMAMFLEPIRKGILMQAKLIRENINRCSHISHFYIGQFSWEIERVIRTVEKFKGKGTDYVPAIKLLRAALDQHSEYKKITFSVIEPLDKWIREQK